MNANRSIRWLTPLFLPVSYLLPASIYTPTAWKWPAFGSVTTRNRFDNVETVEVDGKVFELGEAEDASRLANAVVAGWNLGAPETPARTTDDDEGARAEEEARCLLRTAVDAMMGTRQHRRWTETGRGEM